MADFGGMSAPEILFERQGVSGNSQPGGAEGQGNVGIAETSVTVPNSEVYCLQGNGIDRYAVVYEESGFGKYRPGVGTLKASGGSQGGGSENPVVTISQNQNGEVRIGAVANTLNTNGNASGRNAPLIDVGSSVRRLTPLECERLQGFPDNWTDIGPWRDSKGKLHKECSDSARYKALGNSIALPSWVWVLERLSSYCGERPTMASLFDGIGGFPLVWERINGKGSCIWASEIDEFPMAVTKYHFPEEEEV